jgi:DNA end-binding protein Ku
MPTASANPPSRAHTSITLAWGLVSIPLSVYTGTEPTRVQRKEFLNGNPLIEVGRSPIRKDTGDVVSNADVTRMAEASNGAWVVLTDEEIAACTSPKGLAEVQTFVPLKHVDAYLTEGLVQVRPKRTKNRPDPAATKAFALLLTAMGKRKVAALVKVAMRGPARYGLLMPNGDLRLVLTADAVRQRLTIDDDFTFSKQEMDLAGTLIDAIGVDTPVITDDTAPVVQRFVDDKAQGVTPPPPPATPAIPTDVMAAINASIEAAKAKKAAA